MSGYFEQEIVWYECRMCGTVFWKIHLHFQIFFHWGGGGGRETVYFKGLDVIEYSSY